MRRRATALAGATARGSLGHDEHVARGTRLAEDRPSQPPVASRGTRGGGGGGGGAIRVLAMLLWLIPLGLAVGLGLYGYRQYEQIRSKPQVTIGLVQTMTSGEAEKLLSAKGYLKSRNQALIGAKIPGRVERMFVEEGTKVKKGQVLAVLEHNELKAMLASRQATVAADRGRAARGQGRRARQGPQGQAGRPALQPEDGLGRGGRAGRHGARHGRGAGGRAGGGHRAREGQRPGDRGEHPQHAPRSPRSTARSSRSRARRGRSITPGAMSASISRSAVVSLANLDRMDVETDIAENLLSRVAIGQPAEISVSAVPSKHYRGQAPPDHPDGRPHARDHQGQGRDPRPRRAPLPRARRHRPLPARQGDPQPGREPGVPVRPQGGARSRRTATRSPGSSTAGRSSRSAASRRR